MKRRGAAGHAYARERFSDESFAGGFDALLGEVLERRARVRP
jgi:hypothetical protein